MSNTAEPTVTIAAMCALTNVAKLVENISSSLAATDPIARKGWAKCIRENLRLLTAYALELEAPYFSEGE